MKVYFLAILFAIVSASAWAQTRQQCYFNLKPLKAGQYEIQISLDQSFQQIHQRLAFKGNTIEFDRNPKRPIFFKLRTKGAGSGQWSSPYVVEAASAEQAKLKRVKVVPKKLTSDMAFGARPKHARDSSNRLSVYYAPAYFHQTISQDEVNGETYGLISASYGVGLQAFGFDLNFAVKSAELEGDLDYKTTRWSVHWQSGLMGREMELGLGIQSLTQTIYFSEGEDEQVVQKDFGVFLPSAKLTKSLTLSKESFVDLYAQFAFIGDYYLQVGGNYSLALSFLGQTYVFAGAQFTLGQLNDGEESLKAQFSEMAGLLGIEKAF